MKGLTAGISGLFKPKPKGLTKPEYLEKKKPVIIPEHVRKRKQVIEPRLSEKKPLPKKPEKEAFVDEFFGPQPAKRSFKDRQKPRKPWVEEKPGLMQSLSGAVGGLASGIGKLFRREPKPRLSREEKEKNFVDEYFGSRSTKKVVIPDHAKKKLKKKADKEPFVDEFFGPQ